jgi:membrane protein required for colicin V production
MNYLDFLIMIPCAWAAYKGFKKGLIIEVFTLLALLVGIYAGIHFSDWTAGKLQDAFESEWAYWPALAFTITFLGVGAMIYFGGKTLEKMISVVNLSPLNKGFGVFFGILKMVYTLSILFVLLESYDPNDAFIPTQSKDESLLYVPVRQTSVVTMPFIEESKLYFHKIQGDSLEVDDAIRLKQQADSLGIDPVDAARKVNEVRSK